jgi:hypothetical protein
VDLVFQARSSLNFSFIKTACVVSDDRRGTAVDRF